MSRLLARYCRATAARLYAHGAAENQPELDERRPFLRELWGLRSLSERCRSSSFSLARSSSSSSGGGIGGPLLPLAPERGRALVEASGREILAGHAPHGE
jgi:hypothetical protein